jgi:GDSL-like Lipase/Acylhydrolase family
MAAHPLFPTRKFAAKFSDRPLFDRAMSLASYFPTEKLRLPLALVAAGAVLVGVVIAAGHLGLGLKEDFVLYRWFGLSRTDSVLLGAALIALAFIIALIRPYWREAALVSASVLIILVALEVGLRIADGLPAWPDRNLLFERTLVTNRWPVNEYHPVVGWVHKPNLSFNADSAESSFTTGEFGVRMNQAKILPVPRGAVLAVGNSFTEGAEVGDRGSWPASLERTLGEPVVNAGIGGWAADQIVLRAEELMSELSPKAIIVSFASPDIAWTVFRVHAGGPKPYFLVENGQLVPMNSPVPRTIDGAATDFGLLQGILGYSYLVDWTMSRLGVTSWVERGVSARVSTDPVMVSCLLLERLKRATDARGITLLLMMQWGGNEVSDQAFVRWPYSDDVLRCAKAAGIRIVDTWGPLRAVFAGGEDKLKELYVRHTGAYAYGHMSPAGNQFVAELLAKALRD